MSALDQRRLEPSGALMPPGMVRNLLITVVGVGAVWLFAGKSVNCAAGVANCFADARVMPAVISTIALIALLAIGVVVSTLTPPAAQRRTTLIVTVVLVIGAVVASGVVFFAAGSVLWPIWA